MKQRLLKNSMLYIIRLKQQLHQINICWILILPYQTLFIILASIQSVLVDQGNQATEILKNIWQKFNDTAVCHFFLFFQAISCVLLCFAFLGFIFLKKKIGELDERTNSLKKLIGVSAALVVLMEAFLFNMSYFIVKLIVNSISGETPQKMYENTQYLIPFCLIAIVGIGFINNRIRIKGSFFIVSLTFDKFNTNLSFLYCVLGILINMYLIRTDENLKFLLIKDRNLRKTFHLLMISFYIWKLIYLIEPFQNQSYLKYIYLLAFMFIAILIGVVKFVCKVNRKLPPVIQLCQCIQILAKKPEDIHSKLIALQIENEYIKNNDDELEFQRYEVNNIKNWNNDEWYDLVQKMILNQYQKYPSLPSGIDMIKCRLMIKDKQIFDIVEFMKDLIQKNKYQSLTVMYELLKLSLRIEETYFKKHETNKYPIIQILRQVNRLNEMFYKNADLHIKKMNTFWETMISKKLKSDSKQKQSQIGNSNTQIHKLTVQIYRGIGHLEQTVKKIEFYSIADRQKKVLKSIKQICFQLSQQKEQNAHELQFQKNSQQSLSNSNIQNDFLQFMEVANEKITSISLKMIADLRYHKRQVLGQSLNFLIPTVYVQSIQQSLKNHAEPVYKFPFLIPVRCSDQSVILKRLTTYLEIDSESGYKIVFHFERTYAKREPFVIYNTASNIIESYNRAFIETYKLDGQKLNTKIANNYLNPDELFLDLDLRDKNIQTKLSENGFETEYNCRLKTAKFSKNPNVTQGVRVSLIQKQKGFMILKIIKGHRMKSIGNDNGLQMAKSIMSSNIEVNSHEEAEQFTKMRSIDQNQIYCKIENPYETKISNKKLEISKPKRVTLQFYAVLLVCISLIMFLMQGIVFIVINFQLKTVIDDYNKDIINEYKQYTLLMIAYENYFEQALIQFEKDRLIALGMDYNTSLLTKLQQIESKIDVFQNEYIGSILNTNQQVFEYQIKFKYFQITTDTSKTNLFDFSQNLLQYSNNESLQFLRVNYPAFSNLIMMVNEQANGISDDVFFLNSIYYIVSGSVFAVVLACLIFSTVIRLKVCWICSDVEHIFKLVSCSNLKALFRDLADVSKNIMENGQEQKSKHLKSKQFFESSVMIQAEANDKLNQSRMQLNGETVVIEEDLQQKQQTMAVQKQKQENAKKSQISTITRNVGIFEYASFTIIILVAAISQVQYFRAKVDNDFSVINYKIENQKISQNTIHQILEVTYHFVNRNTNNTHVLDIKPFMNKLTINDKYLPADYFGQYSQQTFNRDLGDLCQVIKDKNILSFDFSTCNQVGGGIFKFGLTKTIEYFNQILLGSVQNQYWYSRSQFSNLSIVQQVQYIQQMITAISNQNEQEFQSFYQKFTLKMEEQAIGILVFQVSLAILLLLVVFKVKKFIYETGQVARGYFLLLPQKVLIQSKILDHIRKQDILNRISKI